MSPNRFSLLFIWSVILPMVFSILIPSPIGPFNTTLDIMELTDHTRMDPFSPTPRPRSLMISVFQPMSPSSCSPTVFPYMDSITAEFEGTSYAAYGLPNDTFSSLHLQGCESFPKNAQSNRHVTKQPGYPLILFTPALGTSRLLYNALAQRISSAGYVVVTIDHPYDADIVTFPDNHTVLAANISTEDQILLDVDTRAKDIFFVLDELTENKNAESIFASCAPDKGKVGLFGHSLGGAAAATAMLHDHRILGGINLDGTFWGSVISRGLTRPFMLFAHEGKNGTNDPSWGAIWPNLKGWKRDLMLSGSAHYAFSDFPLLIDVLGLRSQLPPEVAELVGTIDGKRDIQILGSYITAFFDFVLRGQKQSLLSGPSAKFPEVSFVTP
ncbi:PAF acetylhydrolase family protein [Xylogone sp. PMI_703]|nr:PAF acetylhydrolase family protein [Xylogone sp. PMI_703]